ncbi:Putative helicase, Zinc finger, RING-type, Zinc finger, RING/FYVE/PHD-type [Septoria linicola]|uniref:Helicase, Zinc finger, RING-type, Zinc finger, RING/FYVE/PHD-type n=1 Tax=Septoria linicola TaxID=215465 RepID=A0A9Q9ELM2_9PEZI|nr:Putative helicase, Zinc finger, RING-type, Zinc finger, RING/FYVE/PHD-type [Septoria linicola]
MDAANELDVVLDDISFNAVLIESLDADDEEYQLKLDDLQSQRAGLQTKRAELEARLNQDSRTQSQASNQFQNHSNMNGMNNDAGYAAFWNSTMTGQPSSHQHGSSSALRNGFSSDSAMPFGTMLNGVKRPRPQSAHLQPDGQAYKRQTPDPSNAPTPTSSDGSYEFVPRESWQDPERDRLFQRQQMAEQEARRRREQDLRDEEYARQLSQQGASPHGQPSSSRSNVQTTINMNGGFRRPPVAAQAESSRRNDPAQASSYSQSFGQPQVKTEQFTFPRHQQLATRPRQPPTTIDLTNSDSEDDIAEIGPANFVHNHRQQHPQQRVAQPQYQMPGTFPTTPNNGPNMQVPGVFGNPPGHAMNNNNNMWQNLQNMVRDGTHNFRNQLHEVGSLVYGNNAGQPWNLDDDDGDDDVTYMGVRPLAGYAGREALYQDRYAAMQNYDPTKTREEIQDLLSNIRPDEDMPAHLRVQTPEDLTVRLHKYQEVGLTWLKNQEEGSAKGGILADDMGLGKTIQMLSLMVTRKSEDFRCKTTLIVAPVALLRQWKQEIQNRVKAAPQYRLSVFTHHGTTKAKDFDQLRTYDVVLTTYGSIASELKKLENFTLRKKANPNAVPYPSEKLVFLADNANWYRVVLDEAQCIKNRNTQTAKGACLLKAKYRFCVTGTPMMNNVEELYSLIKFLRIKPYCHWEKFRIDFNTPLRSAQEDSRNRAMRQFQVLCKSIMLRRTKKSKFEGEPILNLPERSTTLDNPVFDQDEQAFYTALETQTQVQFNKYLRRGTVGQQYSAILVLLLRLRQACCHPHLIKDFGVAAAADMTEDQMLTFAKQLDPQVVERIKATGGNFECPVCYDAVSNPAIFIPCGHDTCSECFSKIADPANAIQQGNENGGARCPNCRGGIDAKRLTDFNSFKKVHMPELLTDAERAEMNGENDDLVDESEDSDDDSDEDSSTESEDEDDGDETLGGFIVPSDEEESVAEKSDNDDDLGRPSKVKKERRGKEIKHEPDETDELDHDDIGARSGMDVGEGVAGPSTVTNGFFGPHAARPKKLKSKKSKGKEKAKKSNKGKGKAKQQPKKKKKGPVTLAELKKDATKSRQAKQKYLKRLRKTYIGSAKIDKTMEILKEIMQAKEGEKVLIFSQWTSLLDLLEIPIDGEGFGYRRYDGSMTANMRADAVDDFKDEQQNVRIMLVSLKAGNAGLNLNMASQVIILDPFWNPYIEEQAIDRAHRIGQMRPVTVHRVLIAGTVEDRIIELQEKKRVLISEALDEKSAANLARLGVQELAYLFGVTANPAEQVQYRAANARR